MEYSFYILWYHEEICGGLVQEKNTRLEATFGPPIQETYDFVCISCTSFFMSKMGVITSY